MENRDIITNELPIKLKKDDLLNYYPFAVKIKEIIQGYSNNSSPLTIGIYGKWGTGKTSLLNLLERHIELFQKDKDDKLFIKFHYNPWLYQSKEEMLFDFFNTLSRKLIYSEDEFLKKAGTSVLKYSRYLESIRLSVSGGIPNLFNAGITVEPYKILKALGEDIKGEKKSLEEMKGDIDDALESSNKKIIIFIDDIDRLDKEEIFMLFKLIKTNADFKNLVFVICLDHEHVSKAIFSRFGSDLKSGKKFLEKIINIPLELPLIEKADFDLFIKEKVKSVIQNRLIRKEELDELLRSLSVHYFDTPREVIRIVNSFSVSLYAIGDEVNAHDLFWIEYLKIKYIGCYEIIKRYAQSGGDNNLFNSVITFNNQFEDNKSKSETGVRLLLKNEHPEGYNIIEVLFPMDKSGTVFGYQSKNIKSEIEIDTELRINHMSHFEKYFSFHIKGKVSELKLSNLKSFILDDKKDNAMKVLEELIVSTNEYKIAYRLGSELENMDQKEYEKYIPFLVDNIDLLNRSKEHNISFELILSISKKLNKEYLSENKELILSIGEKLDYLLLVYLIENLRGNSEFDFLKDLELLLISKVKNQNSPPFYNKREYANIIMKIWSKINYDEFQRYIMSSLQSQENIFDFIKTFPFLWNDNILGMFKENNYNFLKDELKLDPDIIFEKINNLFSDDFNLKELENEAKLWNDKVKNSEMNNLRQYVYHHLKSKESPKTTN
ncbi:P-loop NTPase fold protein [Maribacter sp.]|uniref:KAP family P-loop NTPase fold protein n=1 Tax=Maribacter sp. TaxID=1897614 RepID=UPI00329886FB